MKLVILTGFLGTGKTTMLLAVICYLVSENGRKFVIVESEVGEIGIDGTHLVSEGLDVRELFAGCVCCQLAGILVSTLNEIKDAIDPDSVFVETPGIAVPVNFLKTVDKYCRSV